MKRLHILLCLALALVARESAHADAPHVSVTYPTSNLTVDQMLTPVMRLQVAVSDPDDSIASVTYFACLGGCSGPKVAVGVSTSAPYDFLWQPWSVLSTGEVVVYSVWAEAVNARGESAVSTMVPFTVDQRPLPTGTFVAPSASLAHEFVLPAAPMFYVSVTPLPSTTVARVDFLDSEEVIGTVATSNAMPNGYAFVWRDPPLGDHLISARVIDSIGNSATSVPVSVYIGEADEPPQVSLTSPETGQSYMPNDAVALSANAFSSQGVIERVEFRVGETVVATARSAPFTATWGGPPPGNMAIVAVAFDDLGVAGTSAPAYIQVRDGPRRPAVALTAPTPGSTISAASPLQLTADAVSPDGTIARVDFYAGNTLLGSATGSPYTLAWTNPQVGNVTLSAKAYDLRNVATVSSPVVVTVTSSLVPSVNLTAPASGASFNAPASVTVTANAGETGGTIAKVDFYASGTLIGSKASAPYTVTWTAVAAGGYTISAKVTDAVGVTANSVSVPITVYPPASTVVLTAPTAGTRYASGQSIALTAQANTPGTSISKIEFDSDGVPISTVTASGTASSGSFTLNWSGATPGSHAIAAKVFSASGATATSAPVTITVADLGVALLEPANGQVFQTSVAIPLAVNPTDPTGTIARVDYYADGALVATRSAAPYTAAWNGAINGSHSITAKIVDTSGLIANSTPVTITVLPTPTLQVDGGISGTSIDDDYAMISGSIQAPLNSAVAINGQHAVLSPDGRFFIDVLKLQPGANTITLTLNAQGFTPVVSTINLSSTGVAPFEVTLDKQEGLAPLTVDLSIVDRGSIAFKRITIDTTDDGVADIVLTGLPAGGTSQPIIYGAPGLYTIRVVVYDANDNPIYTATRRVRAIDPREIGYKVASVYTTLVNNLAANNVGGALTAFVDGARDRYASVFTDLGTALSTIATQLGSLSNISLMEDVAELTVARPVGTDTQLFMIYLIRGNDGLWRIETM
jgi:hypothetical protein